MISVGSTAGWGGRRMGEEGIITTEHFRSRCLFSRYLINKGPFRTHCMCKTNRCSLPITIKNNLFHLFLSWGHSSRFVIVKALFNKWLAGQQHCCSWDWFCRCSFTVQIFADSLSFFFFPVGDFQHECLWRGLRYWGTGRLRSAMGSQLQTNYRHRSQGNRPRI